MIKFPFRRMDLSQSFMDCPKCGYCVFREDLKYEMNSQGLYEVVGAKCPHCGKYIFLVSYYEELI
jgi:ribosomal protein S27AE